MLQSSIGRERTCGLGWRRSKMKCGLSADVRVRALGEIWSNISILVYNHQPSRRRAAAPNMLNSRFDGNRVRRRGRPRANEGRTDRLTGLTERLVGDAGRLDGAIGGLRRSKMRCGHSVAVRVGAIEKCGHMVRRRAAAQRNMWSKHVVTLSSSGV